MKLKCKAERCVARLKYVYKVLLVSNDLWYISMFIFYFFVSVDICDGQETFTARLYGNYQETIQWYIDADINIKTDILLSCINVGYQWNT